MTGAHDLDGLAIAVLMGALVLLGAVLAPKLHLPTPLVLLLIGVVAGFVPALGDIELPPEVMLLIFLPALLYWESLNTSPREIKRNLRVVLLQAVPLVLVTIAIVAAVGRLGGLTWAVAIALGAIVAPTDATAMSAVATHLPRRVLTILRAESLINDGTALAIYAVAVDAVLHHRELDFGMATVRFLAAYAGGIAIGIVFALIVVGIRSTFAGRPLLANTVSVLTPFAAYLPAEQLGVSGVIAVVTCGLVLSRFAPRIVDARTRTQATGFWSVTTFILNGTLFLLVGFQAHSVVEGLAVAPGRVLMLGLAVLAAVICVRIAWGMTVPYLIRAIDRRPAQRARRAPVRQRTVTMWAGFRGAVSLAAALALPRVEFFRADRELLISVTFIVILGTLLLQGLTFPAVVRWARLPADPSEHEEEQLAHRVGMAAARAEIPRAAERLEVPDSVRDRMVAEYEQIAEQAAREQEEGLDDGTPMWSRGSEGELRRSVIAAKRAAVIGLRDRGEIDDTVLRRIQDRLDIEELRLTRAEAE